VLITSSGFTCQNLSAVSLPSGGKAWLECTIGPGATLSTVNYNP